LREIKDFGNPRRGSIHEIGDFDAAPIVTNWKLIVNGKYQKIVFQNSTFYFKTLAPTGHPLF